MKKFIRIIFCILVASIFFTSCESTKEATPLESEKVVKTYVNTTPLATDGKIYTTLVFKEITKVVAINMKTHERVEIPNANYEYNQATTELSILFPKSISDKKSELVYNINGNALYPAVFVLVGADTSRASPGVFIIGKKMQEKEHYTFDKKTCCLKSLLPVNPDLHSYVICWATANGTVTFSNEYDDYKKNYDIFVSEWAKSVKK